MELRRRGEEVVGEAPQELRNGQVEGEAGGSLGWGEEVVVVLTCLVGMEVEAVEQRQELWREEVVAGHLVPGQEGEEGLNCDAGVGEEGHLWMEEVEELEREIKKH